MGDSVFDLPLNLTKIMIHSDKYWRQKRQEMSELEMQKARQEEWAQASSLAKLKYRIFQSDGAKTIATAAFAISALCAGSISLAYYLNKTTPSQVPPAKEQIAVDSNNFRAAKRAQFIKDSSDDAHILPIFNPPLTVPPAITH